MVPRNLETNSLVILRVALHQEARHSTMQVLTSCTGDRVIRLRPDELISELEVTAYVSEVTLVTKP
jgi:hypothetical protein